MGQHRETRGSASERHRREGRVLLARALEQRGLETPAALGGETGTTSRLHGSFSALSVNQWAWMSYLAAASVYGLVLFLLTHV
jgi:hypothetical protein